MEPCDLSAVDARRLIGKKKLSPVELLESCLARIEAVNGTVNAVVSMDAEAAMEAAKDAEEAVMEGDPLSLLHGLPIGIKDLEATAGLRTTYGSLLYQDHVPEADQGSVFHVRASGGIILGKTNTPEFGAGANTKNRVFGATGNPFNPTLSAAGSSGGSAAALACGMVPLASGSDFGGSLRNPASFCGITGFRPSPGTVPGGTRPVGLTPLSVNGPMARTVEDLHLLLKAQVHHDLDDPFSRSDQSALIATLADLDLSSLTLAVTEDFGVAPVDAGIRETFRARVGELKGLFGEVREETPDFTNVHEVFEILRGVNFVAAHRERLEKHRDLLGPNVIDNAERGLQYSLEDVAWAHAEQTKIYRRYNEFFRGVDVILSPATAVSPFPHEQNAVTEINGEEMPTYMRWLSVAYCPTIVSACALSLPLGRDHKGMPFGLQIAARNGEDDLVLGVARALERAAHEIKTCQRPLPDLSLLKG